jgi:hypothetical protein
VIDSYVGWPVDMVARKLVKKPVLIGREALENRSMLDLRRPLERGIMKEGSEKDQEAVQEILRHLISLVGIKQKSKGKAKVRAVVGVPAEAFRVSREHLRQTMEEVSDSVMLVSEPFAVAYGLEALLHALIIDIGAGTADFCVMQGRYPTEEDQRTLPNAGASLSFGWLGGAGAVSFDLVALKALQYAPAGASRQVILDAIGRGIGRVAAHELAHQMIHSAEAHNPGDENSYEYPSSDRAAQYYSELHWTTARLLLERTLR